MTATRAGMRLGGRYRLTERLAFGGMGEVWQGVDEGLGRAVAVKILRPELARDDAFRRRFREEARTAGGLSHPGIAAVYDYGEGAPTLPASPYGNDPLSDPLGPGDQGRYDGRSDWSTGDEVSYLVMELVPGKPLSGILAENGPMPPVRALDLVAQAARALHAAHQRGIVHRDVKPANLMVTPEQRIKVTDFGIARPQDHEPLTATGQVMGTAHYLAPELARGQLATPLSDVYALGVVAYECVAGHRPFEGDNQVAVATAHLSEEPPPLPDHLPLDLRRVIMTAMAKDPQFRFVSAEAFAEVLDTVRFRLLAGEPAPVWAARGLVPGVGPGAIATAPVHTRGATPPAGPYAATAYLGPGVPPRSTPPQALPPYATPGRGTGGTPPGGGHGDWPTPGRGSGYDGRAGGTGTAALPIGRQGGEPGRGRPGRRRPMLTGPLLALLALVALVAIGALVNYLSQPDGASGGGTTNSQPPTSSAPVVPSPVETQSQQQFPVPAGTGSLGSRYPTSSSSPSRSHRPTSSVTAPPTSPTAPPTKPTPTGPPTTAPSQTSTSSPSTSSTVSPPATP